MCHIDSRCEWSRASFRQAAAHQPGGRNSGAEKQGAKGQRPEAEVAAHVLLGLAANQVGQVAGFRFAYTVFQLSASICPLRQQRLLAGAGGDFLPLRWIQLAVAILIKACQ